MMHSLRLMSCLLLLAGGAVTLSLPAHAAPVNSSAASGALDFNYTIEAPAAIRPMVIFNDGVRTYIQPRNTVPTKVNGASEQGPYLVLSGTPQVIVGTLGKRPFTARREAIGMAMAIPAGQVRGGAATERSSVATTTAAPGMQAESFILAIAKGENIADALRSFLAANGVTFEWLMEEQLRARKELRFEGRTPKESFAQAVEQMDLPAVWLTDVGKVIVSPAVRGLHQEK